MRLLATLTLRSAMAVLCLIAATSAEAQIPQRAEGREATIAELESAIRLTPWDGALHYRLGRLYHQQGQVELAKQEFRNAQKLKDADRLSVEKLRECSEALRHEQLEQARAIREELLANGHLDPDVLVVAGLLFANAGYPLDALGPFEAAAQRDATFFQAQFNAGLVLLKTGRTAEAGPYLEKAVDLVPESFDANSGLALQRVIESDFAGAVEPLERANRLRPGSSRLQGLLATSYLRTGAPAKAVPLIDAALAKTGGDPALHLLRIEALAATERPGKALEAADRAYELFPDHTGVLMARAQALVRVGRYQEAGSLFEQVARNAPGQFEPVLGLADVLEKNGEFAAALVQYRHAAELAPSLWEAHRGVAKSLFSLRRFAEARDYLLSLPDSFAAQPDLHFELARTYARLGDRENSVAETRLFQQLRSAPAATGAPR